MRKPYFERSFSFFGVETLTVPTGLAELTHVRFGLSAPFVAMSEKSRRELNRRLERGKLILTSNPSVGSAPIPSRFYQPIGAFRPALYMAGEVYFDGDYSSGIELDPASSLEFESVLVSEKGKKALLAGDHTLMVRVGLDRDVPAGLTEQLDTMRAALEDVKSDLSAALPEWDDSASVAIQRIAVSCRFCVTDPMENLGELIGVWLPGVSGNQYESGEEDDEDLHHPARRGAIWEDHYSAIRYEMRVVDEGTILVEAAISGTAAIEAILTSADSPSGAESLFEPAEMAQSVRIICRQLLQQVYRLADEYLWLDQQDAA